MEKKKTDTILKVVEYSALIIAFTCLTIYFFGILHVSISDMGRIIERPIIIIFFIMVIYALVALILFLSSEKYFWKVNIIGYTSVKPYSAKAIVRFGGIKKIIYGDWLKMSDNGDCIEDKDSKKGWGGLRFVGISFMDRVLVYKYIFDKEEIQSDGSVKVIRREESRDYIMVLQEQVYDFAAQRLFSSDEIEVEIDSVFRYKVVNPRKALFMVDSYLGATQDLIEIAIRKITGKEKFREMLKDPGVISKKFDPTAEGEASIIESINTTTKERWGVEIIAFAAESVRPVDIEVENFLRERLRAQVKGEAMAAEAKGKAKAIIAEAKGKARAVGIGAEAEKSRVDREYTAYRRYGFDIRQLEVAEKIAESGNKQFYFSLPGLSDLFSGGGGKKVGIENIYALISALPDEEKKKILESFTKGEVKK